MITSFKAIKYGLDNELGFDVCSLFARLVRASEVHSQRVRLADLFPPAEVIDNVFHEGAPTKMIGECAVRALKGQVLVQRHRAAMRVVVQGEDLVCG